MGTFDQDMSRECRAMHTPDGSRRQECGAASVPLVSTTRGQKLPHRPVKSPRHSHARSRIIPGSVASMRCNSQGGARGDNGQVGFAPGHGCEPLELTIGYQSTALSRRIHPNHRSRARGGHNDAEDPIPPSLGGDRYLFNFRICSTYVREWYWAEPVSKAPEPP